MTRAALAKVHIAKKELGLDDETYRAMLERITGRTSAKDCTESELGRVIEEMKAKGWKPAFKVVAGNPGAAKRTGAPASNPVAKKARAMWISLHQLGAVRDPSERALEAFGARQLGVQKLQWANQSQGYRLIEALKAMAAREGWDQHLDASDAGREIRVLKQRLFVAQEDRMRSGNAPGDAVEAGRRWASVLRMSDRELDEAIAMNGRVINAQAGRG